MNIMSILPYALVLLSSIIQIAEASRPSYELDVIGTVAKKKHPFHTPGGLFIQERASKQLPGPGQHFSFGALTSWDKIHATLDADPNSKLLLVIRHGQAISNWLSDTLGPDEWFNVEETCIYTDLNGTSYGIFDAELTDLGKSEAKSLNAMLDGASWFPKLTASKPTRAIVSPLSRCLETAQLALNGLSFTHMEVEELIRETLGEDTCDARRSLTDPDPVHPKRLQGPCEFTDGLASYFPKYKFQLVNETARKEIRKGNKDLIRESGGEVSPVVAQSGFGLISDKDSMWTTERETQKHQTKRATKFLWDVFEYVEERVVVVLTHSGFTRSLLLAVGREPYRPQNTELVPVLVQWSGPGSYDGDEDVDEFEDSK